MTAKSICERILTVPPKATKTPLHNSFQTSEMTGIARSIPKLSNQFVDIGSHGLFKSRPLIANGINDEIKVIFSMRTQSKAFLASRTILAKLIRFQGI